MFNQGWGSFLEAGVSIIQTDWPNFLADYRNKQKTVNRLQMTNYLNGLRRDILDPWILLSYASIHQFRQAVILANHWRFEEAVQYLEKVRQESEWREDAMRCLAELYFVYEQHTELQEICQTFIDLYHNDRQILTLSAISYRSNKDLLNYEKRFNQLHEINPNWAKQLEQHIQFIEANLDLDQVLTPLEEVDNPDLLVLFGHGLDAEGKLSLPLRERLQAAYTLLNKFPHSRIVVTGGAVSTPFNEAQTMAQYLMDQGIDDLRIIIEPRAKDTVGNCLEAMTIIKRFAFESICCISSLSHLPRIYTSFSACINKEKLDGIDLTVTGHPESNHSISMVERRLAYSTYFRALQAYTKDNLR